MHLYILYLDAPAIAPQVTLTLVPLTVIMLLIVGVDRGSPTLYELYLL